MTREDVKAYYNIGFNMTEGLSAMDEALACHAGRRDSNLNTTIDF